ncbi:TPA: hypothetical protein ACH3X1_007812 [Trebouxia sp. C0004]
MGPGRSMNTLSLHVEVDHRCQDEETLVGDGTTPDSAMSKRAAVPSGGAAAALQCKPPPMSTIRRSSPTGLRVEATRQRPIVQGEVLSLQRSAQSSQPKEKAQQGEEASRLPHHQPNAQASKEGHNQSSQDKEAAGRKGARKKAEINESERCDSELGNVDDLEDSQARRKTEMGQPLCNNEVCNSSHECEGFLSTIPEDQKFARA